MKSILEFLVKQHIKKTSIDSKQVEDMYDNPIMYRMIVIKAFKKDSIKDIRKYGDILPEDIVEFIKYQIIDQIPNALFTIAEVLYNAKYNICGFALDTEYKHFVNFIYDKQKNDWWTCKYKFDEDKLWWSKDKDEIIKKFGLNK